MKRKREAGSELTVDPELCLEAVQLWGNATTLKGESDLTEKVRRHLAAVGWKFWYKGLKSGKTELRYESPTGKVLNSLRSACKAYIGEANTSGLGLVSESIGSNSMEECSPRNTYVKKRTIDDNDQSCQRGRGKVLADLKRLKKQKKKAGSDIKSTRVLPSRKKVREINVKDHDISSHIRKPRTLLSLLIDNNMVLPNAKVHYRGRRGSPAAATGRVTREGIKCDCCCKVFGLTGFEVHARSTNHRPAANIILEDGRTLFDCQREMMTKKSRTDVMNCKLEQVHVDQSDDICTVCHYGGDLVLCDRCPSAYHTSCLGLKDVAVGDWFCPSCRCGMCGHGKFGEGRSKNSKDDTFLVCDQCDHKYHLGCLRNAGVVKLARDSKEGWFCSRKCEGISLALNKILGKPIPVGPDNLTWTLLKPSSPVSSSSSGTHSDMEDLTENYSKLNLALSAMHECFEPSKDPYTNRDIVEDIIFNRESELSRLNFRKFYTVILERNEEIITVGNVRIYSEVAEVPLVATMFNHRRLGKCRVWMDELEKQLMKLGVGRLTLPSVSSALDTWTSPAFGLSKMTVDERLQYLNYNFMDFQGTIMCHKLLKQNSIAFDGSTGAISTVTQA